MKQRGRRQIMMASALGVAAAAAGAGWAWRRQSSAAAEMPPALWQARFAGLDGQQPLAMASLRGKPLVINFWATWCPPCVREMPQFERFHQAYAGRGWQVLGLALDSPSAVAGFLRRTPVTYPIAMAGLDGSEWMVALGNAHGALPFTVVLDAGGRLQQRHLGETRYNQLTEWAGG